MKAPQRAQNETGTSTASKPLYAIMGTHVWGGPYGNLGVNALCCSLLRLIQSADNQASFVLLGSHTSPADHTRLRPSGQFFDIPLVKSRLAFSSGRRNLIFIVTASLLYRIIPHRTFRSFLKNRIPWIDQISSARFVGDICGGDSFSDIYGLKRLTLSFLAELSVVLVNRTIVFFPQTYGPYESRLSRCMAKFILKRAGTIVARDKESQRIAQNLVGAERNVLLSPDVAFALWATKPESLKLLPEYSFPSEHHTIGINVNGLMANGGYSGDNMFGLSLDYRTFLPALLIKLLQATDAKIVLIPHTITKAESVESDNAANKWLHDQLPEEYKHRVHYVVSLHDCHETKGIIGQCDFFIGSRMHSCIAALSQGVPCVGVAYSMKFRGVFESVGSEAWVIDGRKATNAEAISQIMELYQQRASHRPRLMEMARQAELKLMNIFSGLVFRSVTDSGSRQL